LRVLDRPRRIVASVDHVLNPRAHLRHSAEELQRELARLEADPTADDRRAADLRRELRLVEAELAALERHHRRRGAGR
jgi:chromosome segregation ATPase